MLSFETYIYFLNYKGCSIYLETLRTVLLKVISQLLWVPQFLFIWTPQLKMRKSFTG